jgi:hypothetical protein
MDLEIIAGNDNERAKLNDFMNKIPIFIFDNPSYVRIQKPKNGKRICLIPVYTNKTLNLQGIFCQHREHSYALEFKSINFESKVLCFHIKRNSEDVPPYDELLIYPPEYLNSRNKIECSTEINTIGLFKAESLF